MNDLNRNDRARNDRAWQRLDAQAREEAEMIGLRGLIDNPCIAFAQKLDALHRAFELVNLACDRALEALKESQ